MGSICGLAGSQPGEGSYSWQLGSIRTARWQRAKTGQIRFKSNSLLTEILTRACLIPKEGPSHLNYLLIFVSNTYTIHVSQISNKPIQAIKCNILAYG